MGHLFSFYSEHSWEAQLIKQYIERPIYDALPENLDRSIVDLDGVVPFAEGGTRLCFIHPDEPNICIKVDKECALKRATLLEAQYVDRMKRVRDVQQFESINKHYGLVQTSLGLGSLSEVVRDVPTGKIATNLGHLFLSGDWQSQRHSLNSALVDFVDRILSDGIYIKNLFSDNICVQRLGPNEIRLLSIDGVGHKGSLSKRLTLEKSVGFTRHSMRRVIRKSCLLNLDALSKHNLERQRTRGLSRQN